MPGFREKVNELFPWEEEKKRRKPQRMDSIPAQTSLKAKVHSKPKIAGQEYLDLYLMMKQKERLEKYGETLGKMQLETGKHWKDMKRTLKKAEKNLPSVNEVQGIQEELTKPEGETPGAEKKEHKRKQPRDLKTIKWSY